MTDFTSDTFFEGSIKVMQHKHGYRFSIDAVILAHYAAQYSSSKILDLGTGCGIIPMIIAFRNPNAFIYGIEIQQELADMAVSNIKANKMESRICILCKDIKKLGVKNRGLETRDLNAVDMVVTNPPYRKINSGRMNPNKQRAIARHEIKASLTDIIETARRILSISGVFIIVYPVERLAELLSIMQNLDIEPKYLRMIYSGWETEAKLVIVKGVRGGHPGMKAGPPLVIYESDGSYTSEINTMFMP